MTRQNAQTFTAEDAKDIFATIRDSKGLIMYNRSFDLNVLQRQFNLREVNMSALLDHRSMPTTICAMESYLAMSNKPTSTLAEAYKKTFGVDRSDFHGAYPDAEAVAQLWLKWSMSKKFAKIIDSQMRK